VIVLTARIVAHVSERRELVQALLAWAASARSQAGALVVHVYEDTEAAAAFCLVAEWESRPTMEAHLRGPEFGALLGALELLAESPYVSIAEVSGSNGTDAVRAIRRAGHDSQ
jgi:quinol monooxygenase YgiN